MNPVALEMMVRAEQMEIRRKMAIQQRLGRAEVEYKRWAVERSVLIVMSLIVPLSLLGISILM